MDRKSKYEKKKEDDDKNKAELKKTINELQNKLYEANIKIQYSLMNGINCLFQLALKDDELNHIALKKDKKYGFTTQILNENIKKNDKSKNNKIFDEFMNSLPNIEQICQNKESKEKAVVELKEKLLKN